MSQIIINTGNIANDGTGDPLRTAFNDVNNNFTQIFNAGPVNSNITIANNTIQVTNTNGNLKLATNGIGVIVPAANFVPDVPNVRSIGTSTNRFNTVYAQYLDAPSGSYSGNLYVGGNLFVTGTTITTNYDNIGVANLNITLAIDSPNAVLSNNAGIIVHNANANILYNYSANTWNSTISVTAPAFIGDGSQLINVNAIVNAVNLVGNVLSQQVNESNLTSFGSVTDISATGNISTTGNVYANIIIGSQVSANFLTGDGSNLTNITASAIVGNVPFAHNASSAYTANLAALATQAINADTALFAINANLAAFANVATSAQTANSSRYAIQADNANSAVVAGMAYELSPNANISVSGNITTSGYFIGNGSQLTGIVAVADYGNANVAAYLPTYTGNIGANVVTANYLAGDGSNITSIPAAGNTGYVQINSQGLLSTYGGTPYDTYSTLSFDGNGLVNINGTSAFALDNNTPYITVNTPKVQSEDYSIIAGPAIQIVGYDDNYNTPRSAFLSLIDKADATQQWDFGIFGYGSNNFTLNNSTGNSAWVFGTDGNLTLPGSIYADTIVGNSAVGQVVIIPNSAVSSDYWEFRTHPSGAPDGSITSALHVPPSDGANISAIHFPGYYGGGYLGWYNYNSWANSLTLISSNNVSITTEAQGGIPGETQWLFDTSGNLTLPALTGAVQTISLTYGGVGYTTANDVPTDSGAYGNGHGMTLNIVADTSNSNAVLSATISNPGQGYANGTIISIAQPSSTGTATVTVTTIANGSPSINYANGQPFGGTGYATTVGSFGTDLGIGPNYNLNDPAILFSADDMLIRTGGTSATGGVNYGEIYIAGSEDVYFGQADNLADSTYPTFNTSVYADPNQITINTPGSHTWTFDNTGNLSAAGNINANAITLKNTDDYPQILFSSDGGTTNNGEIKVDGGTNMAIRTTNNFYVNRAGQDRLAITDTNTDLSATNNVLIQSNKSGSGETWTFDNAGMLTLPGNGTITSALSSPQQGLWLGYNGHSLLLNSDGQFWTGGIELGGNTLPGYIGSYGNITLHANIGTGPAESQWTFGTDGNLLTPQGGYIGPADVKGQGTMLSGGNGNLTSLTSFFSSGMYSSCITANPDGTLNVSTYGDGTGQLGQWTFANSDLTVPGAILAQEGNDLNVKVFNPDVSGGVTYTVQNRQVDIGNARTTQFEVAPTEIVLSTDFNVNKNQWRFDNAGILTIPGAIQLGNAGNGVISTLQQNQNPPFGTEAYGIEMLTTIDGNPTVFSSISAGPDYVALQSTNAGNANITAQGGYGVTITTSNATGAAIQTWTFEEGGQTQFPGTITAVGNISGAYILGDGGLLSNIAIGNSSPVSTTGNVSGGNLFSTGTISASGNIYASNFIGNLANGASRVSVASSGNVSVGIGPFSTTVLNVNSSTGISVLGNIVASNYVSATGNVYGGNVSAVGNIQGNYVLGNGSLLTGIAASSGEASFTIQSSNFNALTGNRYGVNTTSAVVTATLPATPATGIAIFFADAGGAYATNNLIINPNGSTIMGASGNMTVSTNNQSFGLFYNGTTWRTYNAG